MKTVNINITNARSLEDAMDKAIDAADSGAFTRDSEYRQTHRINKVRFIMLSAEVSYHDKTFTYYFEADLEEV